VEEEIMGWHQQGFEEHNNEKKESERRSERPTSPRNEKTNESRNEMPQSEARDARREPMSPQRPPISKSGMTTPRSQQDRAAELRNVISLEHLKENEAKKKSKGPTEAHLGDLRNALAAVLQKTEQVSEDIKKVAEKQDADSIVAAHTPSPQQSSPSHSQQTNPTDRPSVVQQQKNDHQRPQQVRHSPPSQQSNNSPHQQGVRPQQQKQGPQNNTLTMRVRVEPVDRQRQQSHDHSAQQHPQQQPIVEKPREQQRNEQRGQNPPQPQRHEAPRQETVQTSPSIKPPVPEVPKEVLQKLFEREEKEG
jgi:hypothetical protein